MGQYYTPILFKGNKKVAFYSHAYNNGLKLMEHSYVGNKFVETIIKYMLENGGKYHMAWVGDYADDFVKDGNIENTPLVQKFIAYEKDENKIYESAPKAGPMENSMQLIFLNHTKKEYVDMENYIEDNPGTPVWGTRVHPLPLLTAIGNGYGGGDYHKEDKLVGSWATDEIEVVDWIEDDNIKKTYKEIRPIFNED